MNQPAQKSAFGQPQRSVPAPQGIMQKPEPSDATQESDNQQQQCEFIYDEISSKFIKLTPSLNETTPNLNNLNDDIVDNNDGIAGNLSGNNDGTDISDILPLDGNVSLSETELFSDDEILLVDDPFSLGDDSPIGEF